MARPRTPQPVVEAIKAIWAEDPKNLSARQVYNLYRQQKGHEKISERKVQQIVAESKKNARVDEPFPLVGWQPWEDKTESAEGVDHLLRLDAACVVTYQRHLYKHEADWGRRLRVALIGLSIRGQLAIICEYADREEVAFLLNVDLSYTADLDGLVAYKPWLSENRAVYYYAVTTGTIPHLRGSILSELGQGPEKSTSIKYIFTLQMLAEHGRIPGVPWLTSLDFEMPTKYYEPVMTDLGFEAMMPSSKVYDSAEADFGTPEDFLEWLRLTVSEFWAGRPPTPGIPESEGGNDER